jgi:hypothetical protein
MVFLQQQQQQQQQDELRLAATRVKMIDRLREEDLEIGEGGTCQAAGKSKIDAGTRVDQQKIG